MLKRLLSSKVFLFLTVTTTLFMVISSCVLLTPPEVVIQTSRAGHPTNAHLVYAKDGLTGSWTKLTGTNGVYKFTVKDPQGLYSIAIAEPGSPSKPKSVRFFHAKLSETNYVHIDLLPPLSPTTSEDFATLTINIPSGYNGKTLSVFFCDKFDYPTVQSNKAVASNLPKAKADLVIFVGTPASDVEKVAIIRNFELNSDKEITLTEDMLKTPESATKFDDISVAWLVGGTTGIFFVNGIKIPSTLKSDKDLYVPIYSNLFRGLSYNEYRKDYPTTTPFATSSINPANFPETGVSTSVENNNLKIVITPYNPNMTGMNTILYMTYFGYSSSDLPYVAYISSGYLSAVGNNYEVPKIGGDFAQFDIDTTKSIKVYPPSYLASNKNVKEFLIPTDGTKMLKLGLFILMMNRLY